MELSKWKQLINMKVSLVMALLLILITIPNVSSQESDVCIVYFTGNACGDECRLTDSFMDGLINEYIENLVAIKYNVDNSQENKNIFTSYRTNYNLPYQLPMVLFAKDDYIFGMYNIFRNVEPKIYSFISANGTNCPLDSGYVPPGEINPSMLPGQAELYNGEELPEGDGEIPEGNGGNETGGTEEPFGLENIQRIYKQDPLLFILIIVAIVLIVVLVVVFVKRY